MSDNLESSKLLRRGSGTLLFLCLTGIIPFLTRYGVFSQWVLFLHILIGIVAAIPLTILFWKHAAKANLETPTRWWNAGLSAGLGWLLLGASGFWLVGKGIFGTFVPYKMHAVHWVAGIIFVVIGLFHIARGLVRTKFPLGRVADPLRPVILWGAVLLAGASILALSRYRAAPSVGDFTPSNARTVSGHVIPPELLRGSESCGASRCHTAIYEQWTPSAHHFSASDPFYETVKISYVKAQGVGAGRYCAGCHEPISLLSGENIPPHAEKNGQEGSSCIFCHSLRNPDVRGNANYMATAPNPYLFESSWSPVLRQVSQALIRLHPDQHRLDYDAKHSQSVEFCGTCHKQYLDKRVNGWGFVQLQNQYDDWKNGPWHTDKSRQLQCQNCHMREIAADDPARNEKGVIHEHRILASNAFVPEMLNLPGGAQQIELVKQWLTGQAVIPEIAKVWPAGPIIAVNLIANDPPVPGKPATVQALIINTKVGHAFPTGPLDVIQSWLEFSVTDDSGHTVFSAGTLDPSGRLHGKTVEYRSFLLDRNAEVLYNHALWDAVGARDKRVIMPGASDSAEFNFPVPRDVSGSLHCRARLLYRKFNPDSLAAIFPNSVPPPVPITEISAATMDLPLRLTTRISKKSPSPQSVIGARGKGR